MRDISCIRLYSFLMYLSQNFRQTAVIFQSRAQYMFVQENQKREHLVSFHITKQGFTIFINPQKSPRQNLKGKKSPPENFKPKKGPKPRISNPKKVFACPCH